jgi:eukaryotic-like serine/threonine-protein kinase
VIPGTVISSRFVVEREAGAGGMGTVYRALDRLDGARVALKMLRGEDEAHVERFGQEAAILAQLHHPGVVRYVAHGATTDGKHYLAMEWVEGETLARRLAARPLSIAEALTLLRRIAEALASAHARGMVHRDLKPDNLLLVDGDVARIKIVDFGIAWPSREARRLTRTGTILGTSGYIAPEQISGDHRVDARLDVFALGCVFFECLIQKPAFAGSNPLAVLAKILLEEAPRARELRPDVPEALDQLISRMLAKDPAERPGDAGEIAAELARLAGPIEAQCSATIQISRSIAPESGSSLAPPSSQARLRSSLTWTEQRLVSLVLAGDVEALVAADTEVPFAEIQAVLDRHEARLELVAGRALVVTFAVTRDARDHAARAAACALALGARFAALRICVVTGRGLVSAHRVGGDVLDRGMARLAEARAGAVSIDEETAAMLTGRFRIDRDADARILLRELACEERDREPSLLGRPVACVGRSRELSMLEALFAGCADESASSAVLVTGPAGVGKSLLCHELLKRVSRRGGPVEILVGRASSLGAGSIFGMITDAIRRTAGLRDDEPIEARRARLEARLARSVNAADLPRIAAFLGELGGAPFPDGHHEALRAARQNPMLLGDAMRTAWEDWLTAECAAGPVLLVLEDLHWGDAATVRLVDATLRNLRDLPLMVLALARPEVQTIFPALWAERDVQTLKLGSLPRRASERLVRDTLGAGADEGLVARIVDHADGNPFYLEELVRAVVAGRGEAFPDSVLGTVEARLDAEGSEAKRVLRAASVFGERFSKHGVAALLGGDGGLASAWLDVLASREIIVAAGPPTPLGDARYAFAHALVREAAYAALVEADRSLGHWLAAEWLEQVGHADAMEMAEHFRRGGDPARSARWYRRAAEQALEASDLTAAIDRAELGASCAASPEDRGGLLLVEAEARLWRGELALAEERGLAATALLPVGTAAWFRAVTQVVNAAGKLGGTARVEAWVEPVSAAIPAEGAAGTRIICLCGCATHLSFGGRHAAAGALYLAIESAAAACPERDAEATALIHQVRSSLALADGDLGGCLEACRAALAAFEQAEDRRNACSINGNLGFVFAELGDFEGAERALRSAQAVADRLGLHNLAAVAAHNLGHVLARLGKLDEARRVEQGAVEVFQQQGEARLEGAARAYLAEIDLLGGDLRAAEREARAATSTLSVAPSLRPIAVALLGRVLLGQDRLDEALACAREAMAALASLGALEEGETMVRLVHATALRASGREREFTTAILDARDHLLARAAKIGDPVWRDRFLAGVAENAETLALAAGCDLVR